MRDILIEKSQKTEQDKKSPSETKVCGGGFGFIIQYQSLTKVKNGLCVLKNGNFIIENSFKYNQLKNSRLYAIIY